MDIDHDKVVYRVKFRARRSAGQWAKLIEAQRDSGLAITAFCRQHDLAVSTFHTWCKRLASQEAAASVDQTFVRLRVSGGEGPSPDYEGGVRSPVVVRFVDGVELHVGGERLSELLVLLRGESAGRLPSNESIRHGDR